MDNEKTKIERRWQKYKEIAGLTDDELAKYRSFPKNVKAMKSAPAFTTHRMEVEVIEAHNCIAGYKVGDKFVIDGTGMLVKDECPPNLCVEAISAFRPLMFGMWQAFFNGSTEVLWDVAHCPDVGVGLGGLGGITMRIRAVPKDIKGKTNA